MPGSRYTVQFYCPDGQYDELATLSMNGADKAIKYLLHVPSGKNFSSKCNISPLALSAFSLPYALLFSLQFKIRISSFKFQNSNSKFSMHFTTYRYILLACWTYGAAVPAGIFIPSILAGAGIGRLFGHAITSVIQVIPSVNVHHASAGMYSLMGAAALLSGGGKKLIFFLPPPKVWRFVVDIVQ